MIPESGRGGATPVLLVETWIERILDENKKNYMKKTQLKTINNENLMESKLNLNKKILNFTCNPLLLLGGSHL